MSWIAEYDTQGREFPTCVHVTKTTGTMTHGATYVPIEDGKVVRAENAKLRDELDAAKHDLSLFSERIVELGAENSNLRESLEFANNECEKDSIEFLNLQAENAKMRELVKSMYYDLTNMTFPPDWVTDYEADMRELGVDE